MTTFAIVSRQDAHVQGLKRFYTGEPCKRGHVCERFTCNGGCVRCMQFMTPNRKNGAKGTNVGWPLAGLVFTIPNVQSEEMEASFRMIEAMHWHDHCVLEMRKDPTLLEKYRTRLTAQEVGEMEAKLERARRTAGRMVDRVLRYACGHQGMYYGPAVKVGDKAECSSCVALHEVLEIVD